MHQAQVSTEALTAIPRALFRASTLARNVTLVSSSRLEKPFSSLEYAGLLSRSFLPFAFVSVPSVPVAYLSTILPSHFLAVRQADIVSSLKARLLYFVPDANIAIASLSVCTSSSKKWTRIASSPSSCSCVKYPSIFGAWIIHPFTYPIWPEPC